MDANFAYRKMREAIADGDMELALAFAADLDAWADRVKGECDAILGKAAKPQKAVRFIDWPIGGRALLTTDDDGHPVRIEFDTQIEADGQRWVYVYRGTWLNGDGYGATWAPVRRIPMGNYRTTGTPLWDRARVNALKADSWVSHDVGIVMFAKGASPADSLQAAIELGFPHFSHLANGYPVYSKHERQI